MPEHLSIAEAIRNAIIAFNTFDDSALTQHRRRMRLLLGTPALLAHSELRYTAWRTVVAEYVAARLGQPPDAVVPVLAGRIALAIAVSAYERWLLDEGAHLSELIDEAAGAVDLYAAIGARAEAAG
jgi:hypothetical protein